MSVDNNEAIERGRLDDAAADSRDDEACEPLSGIEPFACDEGSDACSDGVAGDRSEMGCDEDELYEIEVDEDEIYAYIVDEDDNEIGFILLDENGVEEEYYYAEDDSSQQDAKPRKDASRDDEYDLGITREGVAEATADMNAIYKDGVAIASELKGAFDDIAAGFDFLKKK